MAWYWNHDHWDREAGETEAARVIFYFGARDKLGLHRDKERAIAAAIILANARIACTRLFDEITVTPDDAFNALQRLPSELRPYRVKIAGLSRGDFARLEQAIRTLIGPEEHVDLY